MSSETNEEKLAVQPESSPAEFQPTPPTVPPQVPQEEEDLTPKKFLRYSKTESIFRIGIVLALGVFLLFFAYVLGMFHSEYRWVPLFNVDLFNPGNMGFLIIIWTAAAVIAEIVKMIIGRYIMTFAVTSLIGNAIILCTVGILFLQSNIMNDFFFEILSRPEHGVPEFLQQVLWHSNVIVIAVVFIILIVETVKIWIKSIRYS